MRNRHGWKLISRYPDQHGNCSFADDTGILATHEDPAIASMKLQATINKINDLAKKWRI
jgi:hypothetical protein